MLAQDPRNVAALVARGDAYYAMGAFSEARGAYRKALAVDPAAAKADIGMGRTLVRSDPRAAEAAFRAALVVAPKDTAALNNLGITLGLLGRQAEAQDAFRKALEIDPDMADIRVNLAMSLALGGQHDAALAEVRPLAADPGATERWRNEIAATLTMAGDPMSARRVLDGDVAAPGSDGTAAIAFAPPAPAGRPGTAIVATLAEDGPTPVLPIQMAQLTPVVQEILAAPQSTRVDAALASSPAPSPPRHADARTRRHHRAAAAGPGGFTIQIASLDHETGARSEWNRLQSRAPDLLGGRQPLIQQVNVMGRTFWRLRTSGFASREEADAACHRLGALIQGCWVT
jgi:Flp pilus assembly protein TadD